MAEYDVALDQLERARKLPPQMTPAERARWEKKVEDEFTKLPLLPQVDRPDLAAAQDEGFKAGMESGYSAIKFGAFLIKLGTEMAIALFTGLAARGVRLPQFIRQALGQAERNALIGELQRVRPVNGRINVGGGFEAGSKSVTNLNPIVEGTGGPGANANIPNHVRAGFEQIGDVFEPGSANTIYSNRLPYQTVNWSQSANGAYRVMAPAGRLQINVWTRSEAEVQTVINAFTQAGFRNVRNMTGLVGSGTMITGVK